MQMDVREILETLPHRYPMLLIDRVTEMELGKRIVAYKNVTINEPHFTGHFPHFPVMPGVLIVEAMAQAAGVLSFKTMGKKSEPSNVYYFVGIDSARFKRPVVPGDCLRIEVTILKVSRSIWKYSGIATVDGAIAAEAELMCTLREIDPPGSTTPASST